MNKKGDIPTVLLFVIALALSGIALFIFASFARDFQSNSKEFSAIAEQTNFNQKYITQTASLLLNQTLKSCQSCSEQQLKEKFKILIAEKENLYRYEGAGNLFAKIRNNQFEIKEKTLKISDIIIISKSGNNEIRRTFNLTIAQNI